MPKLLLLGTGAFAFWGSVYDPEVVMDAIAGRTLNLNGIDLFLVVGKNGELPMLSNRFKKWLRSFSIVTIHTTFTGVDNFENNSRHSSRLIFKALRKIWRDIGACELVVHADSFSPPNDSILFCFDFFSPNHVSLELMDSSKNFGSRPEHLATLLETYPELGVVVDLAHIEEVTGFRSTDIVSNKILSGRIRMVHVSRSGQSLPTDRMRQHYGRVDVKHVPCCLISEEMSSNFCECVGKWPCVLEGALPKGGVGLELLDQEIIYLRSEQSRE